MYLNTILSKYLYYIMTSDYISDDLISKEKGAQYPAVSFDDFKTLSLLLNLDCLVQTGRVQTF